VRCGISIRSKSAPGQTATIPTNALGLLPPSAHDIKKICHGALVCCACEAVADDTAAVPRST
jgi:hypothetical protein